MEIASEYFLSGLTQATTTYLPDAVNMWFIVFDVEKPSPELIGTQPFIASYSPVP